MRHARRKVLLSTILVLCGLPVVLASLWAVVSKVLERDFTIVTSAKLTRLEWQRAIDRQDFLVRLVLDAEQPEAEAGRWRVTFDGEPLIVEIREHGAPEAIPERATKWRFALSIPEAMDTRSRLAAAMALVAYGVAVDGATYVEDRNTVGLLDRWVSYIDIYAALEVGKRDEAAARYPGRVRPVGRDGAIVMSIF